MKHHNHSNHTTAPKRKWWQWVALALMLLAIGTYVITLDDSVQPEVKVGTTGSPPGATAGSGQ